MQLIEEKGLKQGKTAEILKDTERNVRRMLKEILMLSNPYWGGTIFDMNFQCLINPNGLISNVKVGSISIDKNIRSRLYLKDKTRNLIWFMLLVS
jgi:hypothetical protein